jgi:hypothetical protein
MMDKLNRSLVIVTLLLLLLSVTPFRQVLEARHHTATCDQYAQRWEILFAMGAFSFALIPGFQPVAIAYGVGALGAKAYQVIYC